MARRSLIVSGAGVSISERTSRPSDLKRRRVAKRPDGGDGLVQMGRRFDQPDIGLASHRVVIPYSELSYPT